MSNPLFWPLMGCCFIIGIVITMLILSKRKFKIRRAKWKEDQVNDATWYKARIAELEKKLAEKNARRKKPSEWRLIGVLLQGVAISGDKRIYTIVDFNTQTGELRAAPPDYRFFTFNAHDDAYWRQCGGGDVPRTSLGAPQWTLIQTGREIPDILMLGEIYHFRYGQPHPCLEVSGTGPVLRLIDAHQEEPDEPRRIAS